MLKVIVTLLVMLAPRAFAFTSEAAQALNAFQECAPEADTACTKAGNCTQSKFCAVCTTISKASAKECRERDAAYAVSEGLFGYMEGSCVKKCSVKGPGKALATNGHKAGDEVVLAANRGDSAGIGVAFGVNGTVALVDVAYGGVKRSPGHVFFAAQDALSQQIALPYSCIKAVNDAQVTTCFSKPSACAEKRMAKTGTCKLCNAVKSCDDGQAFVEELFGLSCAGC